MIQHTDRGSQLVSYEYPSVLAAHGAVQNMSRKGDCCDNAVAESFFATLEHELFRDADFHCHREAQLAILQFIQHWLNPNVGIQNSGTSLRCSANSISVNRREQRKPHVH